MMRTSAAADGTEEVRVTTTVDERNRDTGRHRGGPGRARRADAAHGPLVGRAGGHRGRPDRLRRLLDLGRLRRTRTTTSAPALHRNLISPFYSPCLTASCVPGSHPFGTLVACWTISPALLILIFPLGFRLTCYYYRKAYYRSFWWSPPACAVADAHGSYSGETRFPLILQNIHRYFFWLLLIFNVHPHLSTPSWPSASPGVGHRASASAPSS